jgi:hypothetical protein
MEGERGWVGGGGERDDIITSKIQISEKNPQRVQLNTERNPEFGQLFAILSFVVRKD